MPIYNITENKDLLYYAETWPAGVSVRKAIELAETKFLRRIEGIKWHDFVTSTQLL